MTLKELLETTRFGTTVEITVRGRTEVKRMEVDMAFDEGSDLNGHLVEHLRHLENRKVVVVEPVAREAIDGCWVADLEITVEESSLK